MIQVCAVQVYTQSGKLYPGLGWIYSTQIPLTINFQGQFEHVCAMHINLWDRFLGQIHEYTDILVAMDRFLGQDCYEYADL